jgi:hypothetical protein
MDPKDIEVLDLIDSDPSVVDELDDDQLIRLDQLKQQRSAQQTPAQTAPQQTATQFAQQNGPQLTRGPTDAKTIDSEAFNTVGGTAKRVLRGIASGVSGDLPALASRFVPDSLLQNSGESAETVREQYQNPEPGSYTVGSLMNPLGALPGSPTNLPNAAWQAAQAGFSAKARGDDNWSAAKQAGMAGGLSAVGGALLPKILGSAPTPKFGMADGIDAMPQEAVNDAFMSIMKNEDPTLVANILRNDPNYAREVVKQYNTGRPGTFSLDPSDQVSRAQANVDNAKLGQIEAEKPLTFSNPPVSAVEGPLQSRVDNLVKSGRATEIERLLTELKAVRAAREAQDMGRSGAAMRSGTNPMQSQPAGLEIPPDGMVSGEIGRGVSEMTPGSVPVVDPVTPSRAQSVIASTDANTSYPARNIPDRMREVIKEGRENSMTKGPSEKGVLSTPYYETVQGLEDSLRNVTDKSTADNVLKSMQVGKAADEAHTASVTSAQGGRVDPKVGGLGPVGSAIHSVGAPISARWGAYVQNRTVDKAIAKMNESMDPQMKQLAQWITSASSPTGVAARSFVAAKQSPEFLKAIQEGDDNDGK